MQTTLKFQVEDEQEQSQIDKVAFPVYEKNYQANLRFLKRTYPDLFKKVVNRSFEECSIFVNKLGQLNIVNLRTGEALYPLHSDDAQLHHAKSKGVQEITPKEIAETDRTMSKIYKRRGVITHVDNSNTDSCNTSLVCLGLGLGVAIDYLVSQKSYNNVVIIEPRWDHYLASLYRVDWARIIEPVLERGGVFAFDIGSDNNSNEAVEQVILQLGLDSFGLYQHLHYESFDALVLGLEKGLWGETLAKYVKDLEQVFRTPLHESPLFCQSLATELSQRAIDIDDKINCLDQRFHKNLQSFERFFPDIASAMRGYKPSVWRLTLSSERQFNLYNSLRDTFWYSENLSEDILASKKCFRESPIETVPNSKINGGKLSHYTFYQYAEKIDKLISEFSTERTKAPSNIPSLIFISLGLGVAQEEILNSYNVDYLYIVEPNIDFFYWSLHLVNWSKILENFDNDEKSLNFSLGDDGTHLLEDIRSSIGKLNGFYLFNSFLFLERRLKSLAPYIVDFREELTSLLTLSEHFHYARYSLSHGLKNLGSDNCLVNIGKVKDEISNVPIYIVGNGPSLDGCIAKLKEDQNEAVIVSCGTALQALWKNNIVPDFHAELEQNRCTYNIISKIPDKNYLKKINYLAPLWTHPETANLFNSHFGILSSRSGGTQYLSVLKGLENQEPQVPLYPSPTVTNFAVSSLLAIGFNNLILVGVDLGFKDVQYHHSKDSLYYKNSKQKFDYESTMGSKLIVRGNFDSFVFTKPEFKLSARNLGIAIRKSKVKTVVNTSDGSLINGAESKRIHEVELKSSAEDKQNLLKKIRCTTFSQEVSKELYHELSLLVEQEDFEQCYRELVNIFSEIDGSLISVKNVIAKQKRYLFDAFHDGHVIFYGLFVSTMNYVHATLLKVAVSKDEGVELTNFIGEVTRLLIDMLDELFKSYMQTPTELESTDVTELLSS